MTFDKTAWQKVDTLDTGVANSVRELYWISGTDVAEALDFLPPLDDFVDDLEDGGRALLEAGWVVPRPSACPGT
jgi:hypothetical protein